MNDVTTATVRTGWHATATAVLVELVRRFAGVDLSTGETMVLLPVAVTVLYRVGRELEARWPIVGRVLFGSTRTPTYTAPEG